MQTDTPAPLTTPARPTGASRSARQRAVEAAIDAYPPTLLGEAAEARAAAFLASLSMEPEESKQRRPTLLRDTKNIPPVL